MGKEMRNKIYSERRRKIHSLFNQILKRTFIAKIMQKNQISNNIEIDPDTGIYNQFAINSYLKELHPQVESNFGIILLSIDNLNKIKENFSTQIARKVLAFIAQALLKNLRDTDLVGRYSESEFILILSDVNLEQANHIAERLTNLINQSPLKIIGKIIPIQASHGVSISQYNSLSNTVLAQADLALHNTKINHEQFYTSTGLNS